MTTMTKTIKFLGLIILSITCESGKKSNTYSAKGILSGYYNDGRYRSCQYNMAAKFSKMK